MSFVHKALIVLMLLAANAANAQERLTLQDAIARALQHNYDIRIAQNVARQTEVNNTAGNAGMLPNVNVVGGVTTGSANTHIEFADGRVQDVNNAASLQVNGSAQLDWTIFDGGKMFIVKKQLNVLEEAGKAQLKAQVQATVSQVIQAYAQVVLQQQQGIAIDTALVLAQTRMVLSQMKFETGISAKTDYLQALTDYNARQSDSMYRESSLNAAFANLNMLMGVDDFSTYIVDDSLDLDVALTPTDKERLEDVNLTLEYARRTAEASRLNARALKADMLPKLALNGAYNYNYTRSQSGFALFNRSYGPTGGLVLNAPIFNGGNIRRQAKVASLQAMRDDLLYQKQNTELARQYRTAWRNYEVAVSAYRLEQKNINNAKENKDIQAARFRVGVATTLEIREAENSYVQALLRVYTAAYNLKVNETQVLELENELVK
jgi:Outer membrane protein